jgi:hypothetical protein
MQGSGCMGSPQPCRSVRCRVCKGSSRVCKGSGFERQGLEILEESMAMQARDCMGSPPLCR